MKFINHIITNGGGVINFKSSENSLYELCNQYMFFNKKKINVLLYNIAFKEKPLSQRLKRGVVFRSCSFDEVFDTFKPSEVIVKLSDFVLNNFTVKLSNRLKSNGPKTLISFSDYQIGPLSNSLYPRDEGYLKHKTFRHYKYQHHIPIKEKNDKSKRMKLISTIVRMKLIGKIY